MIRKAFVFGCNPADREEYIKRHNPIWPELREVFKNHGVHNYSIFMDSNTGRLFGYVELESLEQWDGIAQTEPCKRWWAYMKPLMATNPDNSPKMGDLQEVFHID